MNGLARPRGPLPARIYWVRRTLVLVLALVLVLGAAHLLGGTGDPATETARVVGADSTPASRPSATSTADAPDPSATATGGEARAGRAGDKSKRREGRKPVETETPLAQPTGPCRTDDLVVTPRVRGSATAGRAVRLRLKVTTRETPACTWTATPESLVVKITSGEDRIWSSQDCPAAVPSVDVVVRKDVPAKVDMGWRGQRSDSTCSRQAGWALPGFYHVQAAAFGAEPTDVQFELAPPVAPTRTAKPRPDKGSREKDAREERGRATDAPRSGRD